MFSSQEIHTIKNKKITPHSSTNTLQTVPPILLEITTKSLNVNMDLINIHLFENHAKHSGMLTKPPKDQSK